MNYLQAENISKSFGIRTLFSNISISLERGQKVALVARNGTGKSTLLQILAQTDTPDFGKVSKRNDVRLSILTQEQKFNPQNTVWEFIFESANEITKVVKQYEEALELNDNESINSIIAEMDRLNAWDFESKVKQILGKLKINDITAKMGSLSGGQVKRIALAKILLEEPDLYILDEPTNHLDIDMIEWLEEHLNTGNKTILMVTHDRYFLDSVCTDIYEMDNNKLYLYHGDYAYFLEKKADRMAAEQSEYDSNMNILRREAEWVVRQPKARTTKSKSRTDAYYNLKENVSRPKEIPKIEMQVKMQHLGNKIVEFVKVSKSYGDKNVIDKFSYSFRRGERIAIAGVNGSGKSTFLNLLAGKIQADGGKIIVGDTIRFGFYEQGGITFREDDRVIEHIQKTADIIETATGEKISASQMLTRFDFPPSRQFTPIGKLSGGEKRRLYLLTVLMQNPNFLILDEPTNDLDIITLTKLEEFLLNFGGCLLIVSHDRYFMDKLTEQTFVFKGNGEIQVFGGNYTQWRIKQMEESQTKSENSVKADTNSNATEKSQKAKTKLSFKDKIELEKLEVEIPEIEKKVKEIEAALSNPDHSGEELVRLSNEIQLLYKSLEEKSNKWLELSELL